MENNALEEAWKAVLETMKASKDAWKAVEATPEYKAYLKAKEAYKETPEWKKWSNAENDKYRAARFYKAMLI